MAGATRLKYSTNSRPRNKKKKNNSIRRTNSIQFNVTFKSTHKVLDTATSQFSSSKKTSKSS